MTATPTISVKGVSQSHQPPEYSRAALSTSMPCSSPPKVMPCASAATADPPMKATSQTLRQRLVRQRNSNATPRKISASSIAMIGAYSAGRISA